MLRKDREITDINDILKIIDEVKYLHLGLFGAEYPYIVPLNYGYEYVDGKLIFYAHSARKGYKLDLIRENPKVCVELDSNFELISGGDVPCKYGGAFSSVIGFGTAELVTDVQEKVKGLSILMKHQTGRSFEILDKMAAAVEVIKIVVPEFTGKARPNQPK